MTALRLFLHVLSASIWVGAEIVVVALIPSRAALGPAATAHLRSTHQRVVWPAFAVVVLTGFWNVLEIPVTQLPHPWIELHVLAVLVTGGAAAARIAVRNRPALDATASVIATLSAVAAVYLGVVLTTTIG